ncbi:LPXTG cell wall anchor domain-containing protein [Limosilactobacillus reuteri]|uniref:LPXTG cell wall anchor domain-containing protein n=1 Tax=Limosilactobacillus reuteri TaxID=1598 RepID=UPI001CC12446|nr:LPXTG cell wall anchor domain-containing protein [Limosilactobacillus reuteri]UAW61164.1 LPXTG cell wall anchor domain-containing protein [Limosilactobacillus reuteri]
METGNLADWFSAIGTVFSAIVALYLGLRKKRINVSYVINYNIILKKVDNNGMQRKSNSSKL